MHIQAQHTTTSTVDMYLIQLQSWNITTPEAIEGAVIISRWNRPVYFSVQRKSTPLVFGAQLTPACLARLGARAAFRMCATVARPRSMLDPITASQIIIDEERAPTNKL